MISGFLEGMIRVSSDEEGGHVDPIAGNFSDNSREKPS